MSFVDLLGGLDTLQPGLREERTLMMFDPTGGETGALLARHDRQFREAFRRAADNLAERWGEPDFVGDWDQPAFPDWYEAVLMACWRREGRVAYLAYQWPGPGMPMLLAVGQLDGVRLVTA